MGDTTYEYSVADAAFKDGTQFTGSWDVTYDPAGVIVALTDVDVTLIGPEGSTNFAGLGALPYANPAVSPNGKVDYYEVHNVRPDELRQLGRARGARRSRHADAGAGAAAGQGGAAGADGVARAVDVAGQRVGGSRTRGLNRAREGRGQAEAAGQRRQPMRPSRRQRRRNGHIGAVRAVDGGQ